ncbi:hypothetical protein MPTK1_Vg00090 [Marchantia polymorpha subsp. ruderalis]|uniref:RING-type domain-containing protein n=1 Tax=Marchantia polymorpha TaxID=3197 RepID=A0A2R6VWW6_MARPO|nr:hypothetical protein MARPO_YB0041 [Marchantia polymorpha]BBN20452.1 hypothetical protein Mp_Vg00090 [Marchantia polymorpha subsp. ruderalis]|eukprot:PTQ26100.1 hypothetical protein MARPO_YB0041 [Marchantia polymorpha]
MKHDVKHEKGRELIANGQGVVRCPFCKETYKINCKLKLMVCPNELCLKILPTSCRESETTVGETQKLTSFGIPIDKQNSADALSIMINAKPKWKAVIQCSSCESLITKFGSCNRLICLCGQTICYICRICLPQNSRYEHFCHHERYHNNLPCSCCQLCDLYERKVEDTTQRIKQNRYDSNLVQRRKSEEDNISHSRWMRECYFPCP